MKNPELTESTSNTYVYPANSGDGGVIQNYQQKGDGAETLNVRTKSPVIRWRAGLVADLPLAIGCCCHRAWERANQ
jgi:hypothetical protein